MFTQLFFLFITASYFIYRLRQWHKLAEKIPGEKTLPVLGNLSILFPAKNLAEVYSIFFNFADNFNGIMKFWFGPKLVVTVWDPVYIEVIANSPHAINKSSLYSVVFGSLMDGVFVMHGGPRWKELRKPITKSMCKRFMENNYFNIFNEKSRKFCNYIKQKREGEYYDLKDDIAALKLEMFADTHLGIEVNEVTNRRWNLSHTLDVYLDIVVNAVVTYHMYFWKLAIKFTKSGAEYEDTKKKVDDFMDWIFEERKKTIEKNQVSDVAGNGNMEFYTDFLLRRASEKKLSYEQIKAELVDFVGAGSDTSSLATTNTIMFLAMFPEVQEEAFREQEHIFGNSDRDPTYEDFSQMKYLDRVFKETLRHVGPPCVIKEVAHDLNIGDYTIPKGADVAIFLQKVQKDPKYWERPDKFHPDHFLPEEEAARPRYAYIPFGCGPRMCPGFQYSNYSVKSALSYLIRNFKITTTLKYEDIVYDFKLLLAFKNGYPIKFESRQ